MGVAVFLRFPDEFVLSGTRLSGGTAGVNSGHGWWRDRNCAIICLRGAGRYWFRPEVFVLLSPRLPYSWYLVCGEAVEWMRMLHHGVVEGGLAALVAMQATTIVVVYQHLGLELRADFMLSSTPRSSSW